MEKIKQFWDFLNGNKTAIGGAVMAVTHSLFLMEFVPQNIYDGLMYLGMAIVGGGVVHKGIKVLDK